MKRALALLLLLGIGATGAQEDVAPRGEREAEAARRLAQVRTELRALAARQQALEGERDAAAAALREADQVVNREARALRDTDAALAARTAEFERLEGEKARLGDSLGAQRAALARILRSAFVNGRHSQLKLLLSQDRIETVARGMAYHHYFQRQRVGRIESLLDDLRELADVVEALQTQRALLEATRAEQQQRVADLEAQRGERRALLASLERRFADTRARMDALGRDERALVQLLESLRDVFADIPPQLDDARPFAQRRGALPRPLRGDVLSRFGAPLPDGRDSQGWLIGATPGTAVNAVAPGRVAFADWLKGYGLLLILDHGDGWMSLYAHNDSLFKDVGDWVARGEAVAAAGSSGGQGASGLYFELRHRGRPVNPAPWFAQR